MTIVLTALTWASADRLVNESVILIVEVVPVAADQDANMILQAEPGRNRVNVTVSGARRVVDAVRGREGLKVRLPIGELPTGPAVVPIGEESIQRELAQRSSEFERLRILNVEPGELPVAVDHMITREVELHTEELSLTYDVEPRLQPQSVRIRLRESRAGDLPADGAISIELGPEIERVLKERPFGRSHTISIALNSQPFGPDAAFTPRSVDVTATVRAERVVQQISTVPILVAMSIGNLPRSIHAVARDGTPLSLITQTITVAGSPEAVARLSSSRTRVYGIIHLKEEDLENLGVVKLVTPEFHLPPDVELTGGPQPIELKLVDAAEVGG